MRVLWVVIFLAGCQSVLPAGNYCDLVKTHRFSDPTVDAMTDTEVQQEEEHNQTVDRLCKGEKK